MTDMLTYSFNLGAYRCSVLNDNAGTHTAENLIVNGTPEQLDQLAAKFGFELDAIPVDYNVLLLRADEQTALVDAGFGGGRVPLALESLAVKPEEVNAIVITHTDYDHVGGIMAEDGSLAYANAQYYMLADSWAYWESAEKRAELAGLNNWPEEKVGDIWEIFEQIEGQLTIVEAEKEFLPGISLIPAPGHRVDHAAVVIRSGGECLLHAADGIVHPLFMAAPELYSTYDADPEREIETKMELLEFCAAENALLFASHFPFPAVGRPALKDGLWEWLPEGG